MLHSAHIHHHHHSSQAKTDRVDKINAAYRHTCTYTIHMLDERQKDESDELEREKVIDETSQH